MKDTILLGGPSILNVGYYWLGPAYEIYDITGWAEYIKCTILLGGPSILNI